MTPTVIIYCAECNTALAQSPNDTAHLTFYCLECAEEYDEEEG